MASVQVLLLIATFWASGLSLKIGTFPYSAFPFSILGGFDTDKIWRACPHNSTDEEIYRVALKEATDCYEEFLVGNYSFCHNVEVNLRRCSQPVVDFFVECVPEKAKDLPSTIVKAAESVIQTFCTSSGEIILEAPIIFLFEFCQLGNTIVVEEKCKLYHFESKLDKFRDELPSKREVCEIAFLARDCWMERVNKNFKTPMTRAFFKRFTNAALSACEEES